MKCTQCGRTASKYQIAAGGKTREAVLCSACYAALTAREGRRCPACGMTLEEYRKAAVDAVRQLSADVGIPADLKEIAKKEDLDFLAQSAFDDACRPGNPKNTSVEDIKALFMKLM